MAVPALRDDLYGHRVYACDNAVDHQVVSVNKGFAIIKQVRAAAAKAAAREAIQASTGYDRCGQDGREDAFGVPADDGF